MPKNRIATHAAPTQGLMNAAASNTRVPICLQGSVVSPNTTNEDTLIVNKLPIHPAKKTTSAVMPRKHQCFIPSPKEGSQFHSCRHLAKLAECGPFRQPIASMAICKE